MPKDRDRSHQASDQEPRSRRSSHRHPSHKHDEGKHRSHRHRHTPYHREKEPRSSTHIYFNGSDNASLHTDHVTLASSLSSLMAQNGGMAQMLGSCYEMLERLRSNQLVYPATSRQSATTCTSTDGRRGVNHSNLTNVPRSPKSVAKKSEPR